MKAKMSARFSPEIIFADNTPQTTAVTLTNTGSVPISFGRWKRETDCETAGIDMMIPIGSGGDALCTEKDINDMTLSVGTPGWNIQRTRTTGSFAVWTVYAERDIALNPSDSIIIVLGSVTSNGSGGTVTVNFIFHTPFVGGGFKAELTKSQSPVITGLSVTGLLGSDLSDSYEYIPPDIVSGEQCEGFVAIPYLCPPAPSEPSFPPTKEKLLYIKWETQNAFSCMLSYNGKAEEVAVCGKTVIRVKEGKHTFTLTAYGRDNIGKASKTVTYPEE